MYDYESPSQWHRARPSATGAANAPTVGRGHNTQPSDEQRDTEDLTLEDEVGVVDAVPVGLNDVFDGRVLALFASDLCQVIASLDFVNTTTDLATIDGREQGALYIPACGPRKTRRGIAGTENLVRATSAFEFGCGNDNPPRPCAGRPSVKVHDLYFADDD
jgi:hypothetical protein